MNEVVIKSYIMNTIKNSSLFPHGKTVLLVPRRNFFKKFRKDKQRASSLVDGTPGQSALSAKYENWTKLPVRAPFMKNVFQGKFDKELLAFPEFLGPTRLKALDENVENVRKLIDEEIFSHDIVENKKIPDEVLKKLAQYKLFGLCAPKNLGGSNFTCTERARLMEIVCKDPNIGAFIFNQDIIGHRLIIKYGGDYHIEKYAEALVTGKMFCSACFGEKNAGSDASYFDTYALRSGNDWLICGQKAWVMNADRADLFIVFAKVRRVVEGEPNYYYSADNERIPLPEEVGIFLIEKCKDVVIGPRLDTFGMEGVSFHEVSFNDVMVPECNVLANFKKGYHIVREYLVEDRHFLACLPLAMLKSVQEDVVDYSIRRKLHGKNLGSYGMVQDKITSTVLATYAIESMIYYTAGLADMYDSQDLEIENAMVKIFSSEHGWEALNNAMTVMGGNAFLNSSYFTNCMKNMRFMSILDHSTDMYKCLIALNGLQYVSNDLSTEIEENRNTLFYPFQNVKRTINTVFIKKDLQDPHLHMVLRDYLHPSLQWCADELEKCVIEFEYAVRGALSSYGPNIVHEQYALKRFADGIICIYAMSAVLSRASRSYCIGYKNAQEELCLAETFARQQSNKFHFIMEGVTYGEYYSTDANSKYLADKNINSLGYFLEQPLKLTY